MFDLYSHVPYIYINGGWKRVRPMISRKVEIPNNAMLTASEEGFLTSDGEYFIVTDASMSTYSLIRAMNTVANGEEEANYSPYKYKTYIYVEKLIPNNALMTVEGDAILTSSGEYFVTA